MAIIIVPITVWPLNAFHYSTQSVLHTIISFFNVGERENILDLDSSSCDEQAKYRFRKLRVR